MASDEGTWCLVGAGDSASPGTEEVLALEKSGAYRPTSSGFHWDVPVHVLESRVILTFADQRGRAFKHLELEPSHHVLTGNGISLQAKEAYGLHADLSLLVSRIGLPIPSAGPSVQLSS